MVESNSAVTQIELVEDSIILNEEFKKNVAIPYFKDIYRDLVSQSDSKTKGINKITLRDTGDGHIKCHLLKANAQTKQDVLDLIGAQFTLATTSGKNFDSLYDSMTDPVHKSGPQPGFIAVLEHIPANTKFDKEAREQLLDIFRDTADYWGDRKIPFRCFYSFL